MIARAAPRTASVTLCELLELTAAAAPPATADAAPAAPAPDPAAASERSTRLGKRKQSEASAAAPASAAGGGDGAGSRGGGAPGEARARRLGALLCASPFHLLTELLVLHGAPAAPHALLAALGAAALQAVAGLCCAGTRSPGAWAERLRDAAAELRGSALGPEAALCRLVFAHCRELLSHARQLLLTLGTAPPRAGAAATDVGGAAGGAPVAAPGADAQCIATASLRAAGLPLGGALRTLQALLGASLGVVAEHTEALWALGAPHFALSSLERPVLLPPLSLSLPLPLPRGVPPALRLRPLPASFEQLFHDSLQRRCSVCNTAPTSRALCLACGACVCGGNEALRGKHACAGLHAHSCGAGTSLYLLTSSSGVVLVRSGRLLLLPTPYRDAHGEVDLGLQRGKPLSLDEQEYLGLTRKWLGMSFDDTAKGDEAEAMF